MTPEAERSLRALEAVLDRLDSAVIAYSGGVDSSLLVRVAALMDGFRFLAVTADSPTITREEVRDAKERAQRWCAPHRLIVTDELQTPGYAENPANRCYMCKQTLYPTLCEVARDEGYAHVVDGVNVDDLSDYRPGLIAARELGVLHPFVEAGMTKALVREVSRGLGMETAERPASPCLSSRFPYGTRITHDRLRQVEAAEGELKRLGFVELRVRHLGETARVEVAAVELDRLLDPALREQVEVGVLGAGFASVELSPTPLRSGSLNDALPTNTD